MTVEKGWDPRGIMLNRDEYNRPDKPISVENLVT